MAWNPELDMSSFYFPGGPVGCLLIHGFTGSPPEMRGLGEYLAGRGYTIQGSLLPGHGTSPEDLIATSRHDWLQAAEADLRYLQEVCHKVFVIGLSLGGVIGLLLASRHPVAGVVTMSAPAPLHAGQMRLLLVLRRFLTWLPRIRRHPYMVDPQALNRLSTYDRAPLVSVVEAVRLSGRLRYALPHVHAPALIIHSTGDRSVPATSARFIHDRLGSSDKTVRLFHRSGHNMTVDAEREAVWRTVGDFLARVAGSPGQPAVCPLPVEGSWTGTRR